MQALELIAQKFNLKYDQPMPIKINIGRFKDIPRLFRELGYKRGAEIGVYEGEYSKWILRGIPGVKLFCIDAWTSYEGYKDFQKTDIDDAYGKALANTKGYDCELIKGWSDKVSEQFQNGSLDFVFIDGNHSYEHTVRDIDLWSKKVRPGGIVYGHDFDDYSNSKRWREMNVVNAVQGWMNSYKISPWFVLTKNRNKCWMYVK